MVMINTHTHTHTEGEQPGSEYEGQTEIGQVNIVKGIKKFDVMMS